MYQSSIIKRVVAKDGAVIEESNPKVVSTLGDRNGYLDLIREGMREVISAEDGGTGADMFKGFPYVSDMAAKTGSGEHGVVCRLYAHRECGDCRGHLHSQRI